METMKTTPLGKSYWENEGIYQKELDELNENMPARGSADTLNGELVRAVNRLYYDYCNNGNGNACHIKYHEVFTGYTDDEGNDEYEDEEERGWNPFYERFYDLILNAIESCLTGDERKVFVENMAKVEDMVINYEPCFSDEEMHVYDLMTDYVIWYVLNHADKPLPESYKKD
jgi:hypothetical protein